MSSYIAKFPEYDAIVKSSGGDYSSIASALSTEGAGKRIYVCAGTYSETVDVQPKSNQWITFEASDGGVQIEFDAGKKFLITNDTDITMTGRLKLTGTGDSSVNYGLLRVITSVSRINAQNCKITVVPTTTGLTDHFYSIVLWADYSSWDIVAKDWSITGAATKSAQCLNINSKYSFYRLVIDTFTYAVTTSGIAAGLVLSASTTNYNSIDAIITGVTTTGVTGNGRGVSIIPNANYNSIRGVSRNCDTNLLDQGTGNKTTDLVS